MNYVERLLTDWDSFRVVNRLGRVKGGILAGFFGLGSIRGREEANHTPS